MGNSSEGFHEALSSLSAETRDKHRALVSLQEELEAVDWYRQRADACGDDELREILLHNMREEVEHAAMVLEWLRRTDDTFDHHLRTYLFTESPITEIEEEETSEAAGDSKPAASNGVLGPTVGSLKEG